MTRKRCFTLIKIKSYIYDLTRYLMLVHKMHNNVSVDGK